MKFRLFALIALFSGTTLLAQGDFQKGILYYKRGDCQKAIVEFEAIVKSNPKYEDGYRLLGDCYMRMAKYNEAIDRFSQALKLRSDLFATYYGLALAYYNIGKFADTAATLQKGERYIGNFDKYEFYHLRASALFNSSQYAVAIDDFNRAVQVRSSKEDFLALGQAYRQVGNIAAAQNAFKKVLELDPSNATAQEALGEFDLKGATELMEQKKYDDAVAILSEYVKKNPSKGIGFYALGMAYLYTDKFPEAEQALLNATRLSPTASAFESLGYVQEQQKKYDEALASYKKAGQLGSTAAAKNIRRVRELMAQKKASLAMPAKRRG
ncbi:MAG TPA: tetratricopeptide repeat protein [Acidobacteriota bacterium]|nr:tetratricopeptide repeat protein [Acidobacteriota bacterium]